MITERWLKKTGKAESLRFSCKKNLTIDNFNEHVPVAHNSDRTILNRECVGDLFLV
jgi:hypothetical protein